MRDDTTEIVSLVPDASFERWTFGPSVHLDPTLPRDLDLEGIAAFDSGFVVAAEHGSRLIEVARDGSYRRDLPLPGHFARTRPNKGLESVTMTRDGRYLFATSETTLLLLTTAAA